MLLLELKTAWDSFSSHLSDNVFLYYAELLILTLVVYHTYRTSKKWYLRKKLGAESAKWLQTSSAGWINSLPMREILDAKREGYLLRELWKYWHDDDENFMVKVAGTEMFVTTDPENYKALLATQFNDFKLGIRHSHFKPLLGDGIFTLDYGGWKHSRALLRPNFSREKVGHLHSLETHLQVLFKHIRKHNGKPFDLQELFFRLTVDTATEFLFGHSANTLEDESIGIHKEETFEGEKEFYDCFNISQAICATRAWTQKGYFLTIPFLYKEFTRCNRVVHNFADYYVNMALNMSQDELEKESNDGYIFLYELAKETRDPKVLRDQLLNIMIAGRDTTAGLMSFIFFELAKRPDVWAKLKAEIYERFGYGDNVRFDEITFETLKKCTYLKNVVNETLRLYPSVPVNYRQANINTTLPRGGGPDGDKPVLIEKGNAVGYIVSATHRNEKYYGKDAAEFKPERWDDKNLKPGWTYLPFNGGPRICLGQQFAITEASYVVTRMIQEFPNIADHDVEPDTYPPRMISQLTNSLAAGCYVSLTK